MELKELIERAEKAVGSQKELGLRIGQSPSNIRNAKAGIKGLPDYACVIIAELIGEEPITVIAASNLTTEKKEERRRVWHPFVARAASVLLGLTLTIVNLIMTPAPAEAAPVAKSLIELCILCQIIKQLKQRLLQAFKMRIPKSPLRYLVPRIDHMTA